MNLYVPVCKQLHTYREYFCPRIFFVTIRLNLLHETPFHKINILNKDNLQGVSGFVIDDDRLIYI